MPAINFKQRYGEAILAGTKTQTIRAPRKDHRPTASKGQIVALYTGMRTKSCRKLMDVLCTNTSQIVIDNDPYRIIVNGTPVKDEDAFVKADGFDGFLDFVEFFDKTHGLPFHGTLIEWEQTSVYELDKEPKSDG